MVYRNLKNLAFVLVFLGLTVAEACPDLLRVRVPVNEIAPKASFVKAEILALSRGFIILSRNKKFEFRYDGAKWLSESNDSWVPTPEKILLDELGWIQFSNRDSSAVLRDASTSGEKLALKFYNSFSSEYHEIQVIPFLYDAGTLHESESEKEFGQIEVHHSLSLENREGISTPTTVEGHFKSFIKFRKQALFRRHTCADPRGESE